MARAYDPDRGEHWDEDRQRMIHDFFEGKRSRRSIDDGPFFDNEWSEEKAPLSQAEQRRIDYEEGYGGFGDYIDELEKDVGSQKTKVKWALGGLVAAVALSVASVIGYTYRTSELHRAENNLEKSRMDKRLLEREVELLIRERQLLQETLQEIRILMR